MVSVGDQWVSILRLSSATDAEPLTAEFEGHTYLVTFESGLPLVFSSVCPHAGGAVAFDGDEFRCANHGWRFDQSTGMCINAPSRSLSRIEAKIEGAELRVRRSDLPPPLGVAAVIERPSAPSDLELTVHSHATLECKVDEFSMVCDPWLRGPAFMGAWTQFPPPTPASLEYVPDAIWLSHEHSDHFHEPTLRAYDRATPIYVPAFANGRLEERCRSLGFVDVTALPFGEPTRICDRIALTCFEPGSLWNDASALFEIDGFKILNINDAGLNPRLREATGSVNVLSSAFGVGASGYPLTWGHIDDVQKKHIIESNRHGMFAMLREAADLYTPEYVLPFAGHFALWHPSHRKFVQALEPTHVDAVAEALSDTDVEVLDLMPGDSFVPSVRQVQRGPVDRAVENSTQAILDYCEARFDAAEFEEHHPADCIVSRNELIEYLLELNTVPEILFCEDLTVRITLTDFAHVAVREAVVARIESGRLFVVTDDSSVDVEIAIPSGVMRRLIADSESWDEAHIGYWCRFSRAPDIYHANFWRLLQAPRFAALSRSGARSSEVTGDSIIVEVIETLGDRADRIIRRRGMYCVGCHRSPSETLAEGARNHGISASDVAHMIAELNAISPMR